MIASPSFLWRLLLFIAIPILFVSCASSGHEGLTGLTLVSESGDRAKISVEIADTWEALSRGLTGRDSLPAGEGMLFVISERGPGFWMKDVGFPLSVAFISACGKIVALADMEPYSLDFHDTAQDYRFGLEVNRGWFESHGVGVGAGVTLPARLRGPDCA